MMDPGPGAVVAAAAAFVVGVGVAVYVMLKAARLMTQSSAALAGLQQREDLLIGQARAAIDRVGEQIAMTESITATMDDVTASVAELRGRITALAPAVPAGPASTGAATWAAALAYGVARALGLRWAALLSPRPHHPAQDRIIRRRDAGAQEAGPAPAGGPGPARLSGPRSARASERRAALTGRRGGTAQ